MKILWITNIMFPEACRLLSGSDILKETGGWMIGSAEALMLGHDVDLYVAAPTSLVKSVTVVEGERITYYAIPESGGRNGYASEYECYWKQIALEVKPDVIHIHGTEYSHGLAYVRACGSRNVIVSIQGLKSVYARYYLSGLESVYHGRFLTLHDMLSGGLTHEQALFRKDGEYERDLIRSVKHVMGRTSWDYSHVMAINPDVKYHFCNETLRKEFYCSEKWSYEKCRKHSIFVSQATYPIKGFHQLLKAMPVIMRHFPDTVIRVSGRNIRHIDGLRGRLYYGGYSKIVDWLIQKYGLAEKITFLGGLSAEKMITEYLDANVYVCPSSIENSPNSLGEAQLLGVPCIASYVGGVPDMLKGFEECMYRYEETEMLAYKICQIFRKMGNQSNMTGIASLRHDATANAERLMSIYRELQ